MARAIIGGKVNNPFSRNCALGKSYGTRLLLTGTSVRVGVQVRVYVADVLLRQVNVAVPKLTLSEVVIKGWAQ